MTVTDLDLLSWPPERSLAWLEAELATGEVPKGIRWKGVWWDTVREGATQLLYSKTRPTDERLAWGRLAHRVQELFWPKRSGLVFDGVDHMLRIWMIAVGGPDPTDPLRDPNVLVDRFLDHVPWGPERAAEFLHRGEHLDVLFRIWLFLSDLDALRKHAALATARRGAEIGPWLELMPRLPHQPPPGFRWSAGP